jgi:hypothetical protein
MDEILAGDFDLTSEILTYDPNYCRDGFHVLFGQIQTCVASTAFVFISLFEKLQKIEADPDNYKTNIDKEWAIRVTAELTQKCVFIKKLCSDRTMGYDSVASQVLGLSYSQKVLSENVNEQIKKPKLIYDSNISACIWFDSTHNPSKEVKSIYNSSLSDASIEQLIELLVDRFSRAIQAMKYHMQNERIINETRSMKSKPISIPDLFEEYHSSNILETKLPISTKRSVQNRIESTLFDLPLAEDKIREQDNQNIYSAKQFVSDIYFDQKVLNDLRGVVDYLSNIKRPSTIKKLVATKTSTHGISDMDVSSQLSQSYASVVAKSNQK